MSPAPLYPVAQHSTLTPEAAVEALRAHCHVVSWVGAYVLVHASPAGVLGIAKSGFEVYPAKRAGEYYAVKVGEAKKVEPRTPPLSRPGGSDLRIRGWNYRVLETRPKRKMDLRRFEVTKDGSENPYVVSLQEDGAACSCPDWIYRRRQCKHISGILEALHNHNTASQAA